MQDDFSWEELDAIVVGTPTVVETNPEAHGILFFDLETVPDYARLDRFQLEPVEECPELTPFGQMPSPSGVLAGTLQTVKDALDKFPTDDWIEELKARENLADKPRRGLFDAVVSHLAERSRRQNAAEDRRKLLSVTPEYCRIAALGWAREEGAVEGQVAYHFEDEWMLIDSFWKEATNARYLAGFNILAFDIPAMMFRTRLKKIVPPKTWDRYDIIDIYQRRFGFRGNQRGQPGKLKDLARLCGIDVPAGDVEGSQVEELLNTQPELLLEYVRSDVTITRELFNFYKGWCV